MEPVRHKLARARHADPHWTSLSARKRAISHRWLAGAEDLQLQAFIDVPYVSLCQYFLPVVYQANFKGVLKVNPVFWNVRRT
jgi:hypothetical protein